MFVEALRFGYTIDFRPQQKMRQPNGTNHGPGLSSFTKTIIPVEISRARFQGRRHIDKPQRPPGPFTHQMKTNYPEMILRTENAHFGLAEGDELRARQ
jgi:hypothetical protein